MLKRAPMALALIALGVVIGYFLTTQTERPVVEESNEAVTSAVPPNSETTEIDETTVDDTRSELESAAEQGAQDQAAQDQTAAGLEQPLPPADARPARVRRLADGDSFDIEWLDTGDRDEVRMFGINAPEGGACFGDSARDVLEVLTQDQDLLIETIERDEFGRVLGNVWVDDLFVNATMVELGAALALSDGGRYASLITDAQELARATNSGLWDPSACGSDPAAELRISEIFANAPGRDDENKNGEYIVIDNIGDSAVDMTDWAIRDESTRHRFSFPDGHVIAAGDTTVVFSGCGNDTAHELFWCDDDPVWNNGGDTGFLVDPDGRFADSLSYSG